jgi:hypothetical protein
MSSIVPAPGPATPDDGDEDLQDLYDRVWAGFTDPSPSAGGNQDNKYSGHSAQSNYVSSPSLNSSLSQQSSMTCVYSTSTVRLVRY